MLLPLDADVLPSHFLRHTTRATLCPPPSPAENLAAGQMSAGMGETGLAAWRLRVAPLSTLMLFVCLVERIQRQCTLFSTGRGHNKRARGKYQRRERGGEGGRGGGGGEEREGGADTRKSQQLLTVLFFCVSVLASSVLWACTD